jgi:ABC-type nitrate/sulfonate/bicarbonate transport system substrate-binding protein
MPPAEQVTAMANKEIDAAMAWEPWMQRMVHEANARIIATEGDIGIYTNVASYSARRDWLRDHRDTVVRFLRALVMAYNVLQRDPSGGLSQHGRRTPWGRSGGRQGPPARTIRNALDEATQA